MPRSSSLPSSATSLAPSAPHLFVGTSGWAYPSWKPGFYPANVPARAFLAHYASKLTAVEVNYTFRTLPSKTQLEGWLTATPPRFRFSFKAPQRITHFARLRECEDHIEKFLASIEPARTAAKLGPVLFQLPPNFVADREQLARFLAHKAFRGSHAPALAFEFRHPSWFSEEIFALLREHNAALCVAESDELVTPDIRTATHHYYRLRRPGGYSEHELNAFADRFVTLAREGEFFVFHKHEDEPTGALNAMHLQCRAARFAGTLPRRSGVRRPRE